MKHICVLWFFLVIVSLCVPLWGESRELDALLESAQAAALRAGDSPVLVQFNAPQAQYIPRHEALRRHIDTLYRDLRPSVMVEALYLYQKPAAANAPWTAQQEAALYNRLLALSTLAGLQYYSTSRSVMRTLYETSHVVDGPAGRNPLPDPAFARPPTAHTVYARQKDLTFGENLYRYDYVAAPGALFFSQTNLTSLSVGIVTAVGKNNLRSTAAVLDCGEYLLVYVCSMARAASLPGMRERIGNAFSSRAEAVVQWIETQADSSL
jgi:hypothetical protein